MKLHHGLLLMGLLAGLVSLPACYDEQKNTIVDKDKWIGAPCTCEGNGCDIFGVPLPVPTVEGTTATLIGCENVEPMDNGSRQVCLRTIPAEMATTAPPVYFPAGYCTLSAVGCSGDEDMCKLASYGNVDTMTSCPAGTSMLISTFDYTLLKQFPVVIVNKTCVKTCETDDDCNVAGEVSCMEHEGHKFCYNEKNFEFMNRGSHSIQFD